MLTTFQRSACRVLPRYFPRYVRPVSIETKPEKAEAMSALGIFPEEDLNAQLSTRQQMRPPVDLENMHHHIPPASSPLLQFMTTLLMKHGEYAKASKVVSRMLLHIYALTRSPPVPIVEKAVEVASPVVRCRRMKKGGMKTTYVPQALSERQRTRLGIQFIIQEVNKKGKPGKTLAERMARQVIATVNGHEATLDFKAKMHQMAMVNRCVIRVLMLS
jgi:small subunit ribosomal protein S7